MKKQIKIWVTVIILCITFILLVAMLAVLSTSMNEKKTIDVSELNFPPILTSEMIMAAIDNEQKYKVPASITLAQIILESSGNYPGGLSLLAYECNNLFGMKGIGPAGTKYYDTKEDINGSLVTVSAGFRKYHNVAESIDEHGILLSSPHYKSYTKEAKTPEDFARAIKQAGYATDRNYAEKLISIMSSYNLYQVNNGGIQIGDGKVTGNFIFPTVSNAIMTSPFGPRELEGKYSFHNGIDYAWNEGSPVFAADGGICTFAGWYGGGGYTVKIDHGNGIETVYMHMPYGGIKVSVGSKVSKGQTIGCIGNTGYSTGPHLHFEIRINGQPVDPSKYIKRTK